MWIRRTFVALLFLGLISARSWAQTVPASGNTCIATYNGMFNGDVTVSAGQTCAFTGGGVTGNVTVNSGGSLVLANATVTGNVQVNGGTFSIGPSTTIKGNLQIQNIPAGLAQSRVCGSQVNGNLQLQNTGSAVQIGSVSGSCWGNSIVHDVQIQNNTGSIQVVGNAVGGNLQCQNNSSFLEGPNTAPNQQGQCTAANSYPAIVEIAAGADIKAIASALQGQIINQLPQSGTYLLSVHSLSPTAYLTPGVLLIEINLSSSLGGPHGGILQTSNTTGPNWYRGQPAFKLINVGGANSVSSGSGVVIADINSLVDYSHPALAGHLTAGYDFVLGKPSGSAVLNQSSSSFLDQSSSSFLDQSSSSFLDQSSSSFLDQSSSSFLDQSSAKVLDATTPFHGHGTLVAGILSAIAPQSMIMPLRVFDDNGQADTYMIATAIHYAVDHGAQVINMSFSTTQESQALKDAIDYANKAGVALVAAAGNDNTDHPTLPGNIGNVIGVAATDLQDMKAPFSNYGGYIQVAAPGVNIIAPYPSGYYAMVSGTSFSTPIAAAETALIRSLRGPNINIRDQVRKGTVNVGQKNPGKNIGHGRIDLLNGLTAQ